MYNSLWGKYVYQDLPTPGYGRKFLYGNSLMLTSVSTWASTFNHTTAFLRRYLGLPSPPMFHVWCLPIKAIAMICSLLHKYLSMQFFIMRRGRMMSSSDPEWRIPSGEVAWYYCIVNSITCQQICTPRGVVFRELEILMQILHDMIFMIQYQVLSGFYDILSVVMIWNKEKSPGDDDFFGW